MQRCPECGAVLVDCFGVYGCEHYPREDLQYRFEERAAICEHEAGMPKAEAEEWAHFLLEEFLEEHKKKLARQHKRDGNSTKYRLRVDDPIE